MALKIRLRRMGRKKAPTYRVVVAESAMPRDGRFIANIGHYNPRTEPMTLVVDREKALHWLSVGAIPTNTVHRLLKRAGVYGPAPAVTETPETPETAAEAAVEAPAEAPVEGSTEAAAEEATEAAGSAEEPAEAVAEQPAEEAAAEAEEVEAAGDEKAPKAAKKKTAKKTEEAAVEG